mgnify:CR=1 FL=1
MKELRMAMDLEEMPVSGCTCLSTRKICGAGNGLRQGVTKGRVGKFCVRTAALVQATAAAPSPLPKPWLA